MQMLYHCLRPNREAEPCCEQEELFYASANWAEYLVHWLFALVV